jgi:hypothetical protein
VRITQKALNGQLPSRKIETVNNVYEVPANTTCGSASFCPFLPVSFFVKWKLSNIPSQGFRASAAILMRSALFWGVMQVKVQAQVYFSTLHNTSEERRSCIFAGLILSPLD